MTPKQKRIAFLEGLIAGKQAELARIPTGVRSGAYSTDEALLLRSIRMAEDEISALADLSDDTAEVVQFGWSNLADLKAEVEKIITGREAIGLVARRQHISGQPGAYRAAIQFEVAS